MNHGRIYIWLITVLVLVLPFPFLLINDAWLDAWSSHTSLVTTWPNCIHNPDLDYHSFTSDLPLFFAQFSYFNVYLYMRKGTYLWVQWPKNWPVTLLEKELTCDKWNWQAKYWDRLILWQTRLWHAKTFSSLDRLLLC